MVELSGEGDGYHLFDVASSQTRAWLRHIPVSCRFAVAERTKFAFLQIYSGHPALHPLGQHCETMLFKIIPNDFVSNQRVLIEPPYSRKQKSP